MTESEYLLREVTANDQADVIELIHRVYNEYGDRICLDGADSDLLALPQHYRDLGGEFVVLHDSKRLVGCHAAHPLEGKERVCTFRRLYLQADRRGAGHGQRLMTWALDWARGGGFRRVEFWSDTRFQNAHRFFHRLGFQTEHASRTMHDGCIEYREYFFWMDI
jgi:putative acetyltransferase